MIFLIVDTLFSPRRRTTSHYYHYCTIIIMKTATSALVLACLGSAVAFSPQDAGRRDFLASAVGGIVTAATVATPAAHAVVKGSAPQGTALGKIDKKSAVGKEIESWYVQPQFLCR